jgi:hypothetical protein
MTRDKQLSDFHSTTIGVGITYELPYSNSWLNKSTLNLYWDHLQFDYDNYRDATEDATEKEVTPGTESLHSFDADVIRFFVSIWY